MSDWDEDKRDEINQNEAGPDGGKQSELSHDESEWNDAMTQQSGSMTEVHDMESYGQESSVEGALAENVQNRAGRNDDLPDSDASYAMAADDMTDGEKIQDQQWHNEEAAHASSVRSYIPSEPPQTSSNKAMIIVLGLMFVLLAGLCIYVVKTLSDGLDSLRTKKDVEYESESDDPWAEILGEEITENEDDASDSDTDENIAGNDGFDRADFLDESWKEGYKNHAPSEFEGPYYDDFVDCIDESTPYQVKREFEEYLDEKYNVCIRTSYVQLEGDIPNLDAINEQLKAIALKDMKRYQENEADYQALIEEYRLGVRADTKSFVTYNDEETLSVAVRSESNFCYATGLGIKGININLVTGTVMDNTQILSLDDSFAEEFRQRSNAQNGSSYGIELFSNIDIISMLNDEDSIIIFYTPIGLELGYSYNRDNYVGWITISMQDYQKYLNGV